MLHVLFRFYPRRLVPSIQQTRSHYSKPVSLVELHLSFHRDFFHFTFSFLCITTMAFLRHLMSLRLSRCVGKAVAAAEGTSRCLLPHTHTHRSAFKDRLACAGSISFLATSLWKCDFLNQGRLTLLWSVFFFFFQIHSNTLACPIYCSPRNSHCCCICQSLILDAF